MSIQGTPSTFVRSPSSTSSFMSPQVQAILAGSKSMQHVTPNNIKAREQRTPPGYKQTVVVLLQKSIDLEEELAQREESLSVFRERIAENSQKMADLEEENVQLEAEMEKFKVLNMQTRSEIAKTQREIQGVQPAHPTSDGPSIWNFASSDMYIPHVARELGLHNADDFDGKTQAELRGILKDLNTGNFDKNPHFQKYWKMQTPEWKKKFGKKHCPDLPWILAGNAHVDILQERIVAYLCLDD